MKKERPEEKHSYLIDMKAHGSNCFHRLDSEGKEYLRKIQIPTESKKVAGWKRIIDSKQRKK